MPDPFEKHYTLKELAETWACSEETLRVIFRTEPGVLRITTRKMSGRAYAGYRIPESVARRVHTKLTNPDLKPSFSRP